MACPQMCPMLNKYGICETPPRRFGETCPHTQMHRAVTRSKTKVSKLDKRNT